MDASLAPDARADLLLSAMTLEEKVDLATGESCLLYGFYNAPIARLAIPALTMTDGPAGIRIPYRRVNDGRATLLPAPIALAATWDPDLAAVQGDVLGSEAFSTGHNVLLGPTLDLARLPLAGRNFETFGEDPLLASRMAVAVIQGIQRHPVLATAKHYSTYTQERDRFTVDERVDERWLHELYLRPFESAVRDGHVAAVMCGFNRVNGVFACEDRALLRDVLDGELGFDGYVMSDWGGTHTTLGAAAAGLDQELAFGKYFGWALFDAVQGGAVAAPMVDAKARRIVRSMLGHGLFDQPVQEGPLPDAEHGQRSREIGEQGIVLLQNAGGLLPLDASAVHSIAVIGADAANASTEGGGAARVEPTYAVTPLDGVRERAGGGVRVDYAAGTDPITAAHLLPGLPPVPSSVLSPPGASAHGLEAEYWSNTRFDGDPDIRRVDGQVAVSLGFFSYQSVNASSVPQSLVQYTLSRFSARWTGTLTAPATGPFQFSLTTRGRGWLWIDGSLVIDDSVSHDLGSKTATVQLVAGERHAIRIDYAADADAIGTKTDVGGDVMLGWEVPAGTVFPSVREAARLAAADDLAIVVVRDYGTEERDRPSLALPGDQDQLVREVAAANPRTIVVLMTGQPVDMPWLGSVAAVVEAWYPGQEQGRAIARVLFGDVNPSGKLPITFPRTLADTPAASQGVASDAVGPVLTFSEGGLLGYRWYDARGLGPLFPFGHGLSYTSFRYDGAELTSPASPADAWRVGFTITNAGPRDGTEVAQVYAEACGGDPEAAPKQLAGFAKVSLRAGESRRVSVDVDPRSRSSWSATAHAWQPASCTPTVYVGSSSRDLRLTAGAAASSGGAPGQAPPTGTSPTGTSPGGGGPAGGSRGGCGQSGDGGLGVGLALWALFSRRRRR
ncbi:beta-glucosidase H [Anaeromyxobacter diazotrophicus]|uniref:Beta-glucosidase n=1 Tax=Anaeromyxobacter diazotrophicus TaxID=2590199 RepID=A0A7I9VGG1_9BACT|nr:beta-glucosidase [Anaeromyxobacter diazotrophicus]GEJ55482.1 beta-glucosidase [Anaeromyxobacter diazotrophicus]